MNIGIDTRIILYPRRGGAHYIYKLLENLFAIDKENEYRLLFSFFGGVDKNLIAKLKTPNVKTKLLRLPNRILTTMWEKFSFPSIERLLGELDLFHIPYCHHVIPLKTKLVVTIHDLLPLRFPEQFPQKLLDNYRRTHELVIKKAEVVITDSHNSKKDIMELMGVDEKKIRVILLGVDREYRPLADKQRVRQRLRQYHIDGQYILFVGGASDNKNLIRFLKAYKIFRKKSSQPHKLVMVGKTSWGYDKLMPEVENLGLRQDIIFTGYISDEELVYVYNGADLLVLPSLYEGFGLPPLAAMACGVPVIASNVSSLPEVVAEAGILINPYSIDELAEAMITVLEKTGVRENLIQRGFARAKQFSWEKCARETLEVYKEIAKRGQ